jgi:H+-transporting ATPase
MADRQIPMQVNENPIDGSPETSLSHGLTDPEVTRLRDRFGFNEIPEEKKNQFLRFFSYFWGPIPWMIETAALLSAILSHWEDFGIILVLLLVNSGVGFFQERKAENAIDLLKQRLAPNALVLRNGAWKDIPARELVPGDIVHIRLGNIVPGDCRLLRGKYLLLDESALTGESLPVEKKAGDLAYSSSIVRQGEMDAVVIATGEITYFGKTTRLLQEKPPRSHFQRAVVRIGNYLILLAVTLVTLVSIVSVLRSEPILETLQFALILIVAAIPAALPAVMTVTLAVGAVVLARGEAIVSRLTSIEEMAGVDILCCDKTGTLTKNSLTIGGITTFTGVTEEEVIRVAALASRIESEDPIDLAILSKEAALTPEAAGTSAPEQIDFTPFDPVSKLSRATIRDSTSRAFEVVKGAPQAIAAVTRADVDISATVDHCTLAYAEKGYRSLGVARTEPDGMWHYLGVIAIFDPPREDSAAMVAQAQNLGIQVKMVTGDHIAIAREISGKLGLGKNIILQSAFVNGKGGDLRKQLEDADGFAQVFPESKFQIVKILQEGNHIVGMTGDGVNDAPALREADAGIAVAGATDAAKSAADIVLTKPGLSVIIDAIKESRAVFRRMENYAVYRIAETVRVLIFLSLSIIILGFYPITALMIVFLAILNDLPIMMIAYDHAPIGTKPVRWQMSRIFALSTILGTLGVVSSFILLLILKVYFGLDAGTIQTLIFLKLAVAGHMTIYLARTGQQHFWERPYPSLSLFGVTEVTQIGATVIAVYGIIILPVGWMYALLIWGYALAFFLLNDLAKVKLFRFIHPYS